MTYEQLQEKYKNLLEKYSINNTVIKEIEIKGNELPEKTNIDPNTIVGSIEKVTVEQKHIVEEMLKTLDEMVQKKNDEFFNSMDSNLTNGDESIIDQIRELEEIMRNYRNQLKDISEKIDSMLEPTVELKELKEAVVQTQVDAQNNFENNADDISKNQELELSNFEKNKRNVYKIGEYLESSITDMSDVKYRISSILIVSEKGLLDRITDGSLSLEGIQQRYNFDDNLSVLCEVDAINFRGEVVSENIAKIKVAQIENEKVELTKVVFDGKNGRYEVKYKQGDVEKSKLYVASKTSIDTTNGIDNNLLNALEEFDKEFKTDYKKQCENNEVLVVYDFRKFSNCSFLDSKDRKKIKKLAKEYKKHHDNVKTVTLSGKKAAILVGVGLAAAGTIYNQSNVSNQTVNSNIETTIENSTEEIKTEEEKTENITSEVNLDAVSTINSTTEENITIDDEEEIEILEEDNEVLEENQYHEEQCVVSIDNADYYVDSIKAIEGDPAKAAGNTSNYKGCTFRPYRVAVLEGSRTLDNIYFNPEDENNKVKNLEDLYNFIEELKEEYKQAAYDNLNFTFNVDVVDEYGNIVPKKLGWMSSSALNKEIVETNSKSR